MRLMDKRKHSPCLDRGQDTCRSEVLPLLIKECYGFCYFCCFVKNALHEINCLMGMRKVKEFEKDYNLKNGIGYSLSCGPKTSNLWNHPSLAPASDRNCSSFESINWLVSTKFQLCCPCVLFRKWHITVIAEY